MNEYNLTDEQVSEAQRRYADLQIQSMIFDMDIDPEKWTLVEKQPIKEVPYYLARWIDRQVNGDNQPEYNVDKE